MNKNDFEEFKNISKIHMIGIGGISMSGIAVMLKKAGFTVTGSDSMGSDMVQMLEKENIPVFIGSNIELVKDADLVVYTAAINKNTDKEYLEAVKLNKPIFERAPFLGKFLKMYAKPICVAGMHGKTTTTSMLTDAFETANTDPTVLVGSKLRDLNNVNYRIGKNEYFILESCEYVDSFLNFPGDTHIILNIEEEHLDYFKNIDNIFASFVKFISLIHVGGNLIINADDENCMKVLEKASDVISKNNIHVVKFSKNHDADICAKNIKLGDNRCYEFDVYYLNKFLTHINLNVPGSHNVLNALATIATCILNRLDLELSIEGLEKFTGASRRFEFKKTLQDNIMVYDDYAHHPTEVKSTVDTAREKTDGRIIVAFQPHTYSRTYTLFDKFLTAFDKADMVLLADIYAAREKDEGIVSSDMLADALQQKGIDAKNLHDLNSLAEYIHKIMKPNDMIITIGAGTITKLADLL